MGLLSNIFGNKEEANQVMNDKQIKFGRFVNYQRDASQQMLWDKSLTHFDKDEYLDSFTAFLEYLSCGASKPVEQKNEGGRLEFRFFQGSKVIEGYCDGMTVRAEAKIAGIKSMHISFLRRLMEQNYTFTYCRTGIDDANNIIMIFDTPLNDASPYKLYYALKELSINADKQDDLLVDEFESLSPVNIQHISPVTEIEARVKTNFMKEKLKALIEGLKDNTIPANNIPGAVSYLILSTVYKLDFLTCPEGKITDIFERIHRKYFANDEKNTAQKNISMVKDLEEIVAMSDEKIASEFYITPGTFGIMPPINHLQLVQYITNELVNMDWYTQNKYESIELAICQYIISYSLFNYSLPEVDRDLFLFYFQIFEHTYFNDLGIGLPIWKDDNRPDLNEINKNITQIVKNHQPQFATLEVNTGLLNFESPTIFSKSYLNMILSMNVVYQ